MPLLDYNYNYNYNYSVGSQGGAGLRCRPRFNTDIFALLIDTTTYVVPAPNVPGAGGALTIRPSFQQTGMPICAPACTSTGSTAPSPAGAPSMRRLSAQRPFQTPQSMSQGDLQDQAVQILQLALERDDRFDEVIDQDDGEGAINYTLGMLKIDPARYSATNLMVRIARRIGEHVVMCLKGDFMSPRPPQLCPAITPMIDPPLTPSLSGGSCRAILPDCLPAGILPAEVAATQLPQPSQLCKSGNRVALRPCGPDLAKPDCRRSALPDRQRGWHSGGDRALQRSAERQRDRQLTGAGSAGISTIRLIFLVNVRNGGQHGSPGAVWLPAPTSRCCPPYSYLYDKTPVPVG